ncbi:MAG TPA: hypothetical protein ENN40_10210 [Candidatus Aminicenantes bacterium]|nr:hypothetical protein [Candidatus Aminicenantes bacterium]
MIRVLLAGKLDAGMADDLRTVPEFEIHEVEVIPHLCTAGELHHIDAAVVDARIPVDRKFLQQTENLRLLIRPATTAGEMDLDYARSRGIDVRCTPFATAETVADYTLALIMACRFHIGPAYHCFHASKDIGQSTPDAFRSERKLTLGIVGFGRIGSEVGKRAFNLGMEILYSDIEEVQCVFPARRISFAHLLSSADIISLHLPLTRDTRHMLDAEPISRMRPLSILVDLSAPGVVNTATLLDAMLAGKPAAAAMDIKAIPEGLERKARGISGIYPVSGEVFMPGIDSKRSGNDVISILKEFFNV